MKSLPSSNSLDNDRPFGTTCEAFFRGQSSRDPRRERPLPLRSRCHKAASLNEPPKRRTAWLPPDGRSVKLRYIVIFREKGVVFQFRMGIFLNVLFFVQKGPLPSKSIPHRKSSRDTILPDTNLLDCPRIHKHSVTSMSRLLATLLLAALILPLHAKAQSHVEGPKSISPDSIQVTLQDIQLDIVSSETNLEQGLTPTLKPTGGKEAQIWFTLGFMLDSCRVESMRRVGSNQPTLGSTIHDITFRCHYKASEFRSALQDMLE